MEIACIFNDNDYHLHCIISMEIARMGYLINAWLAEGALHLRLVNPQNGQPRLAWDSPPLDTNDAQLLRQELKQLTKQLMLIASAQRLFDAPHFLLSPNLAQGETQNVA